eukprot:scaffold7389_cov48-Phaeocystis_antarctica.AAC.4
MIAGPPSTSSSCTLKLSMSCHGPELSVVIGSTSNASPATNVTVPVLPTCLEWPPSGLATASVSYRTTTSCSHEPTRTTEISLHLVESLKKYLGWVVVGVGVSSSGLGLGLGLALGLGLGLC